ARQRAVAVGIAVLPRRRADLDLRPDAHRELRARCALYAGRLHRLFAEPLVGQLLAGARGGAGRGRAVRRGLRVHHPAPALPPRVARLSRRGGRAFLVVFFGCAWVVGGAVGLFGGSAAFKVPPPASLGGVLSLPAEPFPLYRLFLVATGIVVAVAIWQFLERS